MASSSRTGYHQDYVARIRYSNALPPPPNPPKLLDIPGTGLASGQYTSASFASRLAREQPLNIEADGELGMPIDLIGIPGVLTGDESAIYALDNPPVPHLGDRPLLRPIAMLGKPTSVTSGVSFLRRTEYISSDQGRTRLEGSTPRDFARMKQDARKRKRDELERDNDPQYILRGIQRSFNIAYPHDEATELAPGLNLERLPITAEERRAWQNPRHPTNPDLTPIDTYPLLPDPDESPESVTWAAIRFISNPNASSDSYDPRLDVAIFRPLEPTAQLRAQHEAQRLAHEADPSQPEPGPLPLDYEFFLPEQNADPEAIKTIFDINQPDNHDASLYSNEHEETDKRFFNYEHIRSYETQQLSGSYIDPWRDSIAIALHDPVDVPNKASRSVRLKQKGAYMYPIAQRASIRPVRPRTTKARDMEKVDRLEVQVWNADQLIVDDGQQDGVGEVAENGEPTQANEDGDELPQEANEHTPLAAPLEVSAEA